MLQVNQSSNDKVGEILEQMTDRNCEISICLAFKKRLESSLLEVVLLTSDLVSEAKDRI